MKQQLEKLGFTPNEAKVYLALLETGQTPSGALIKKTGLHRNIVYEALDALIRRRLVSESIKGAKKHFQVSNPQLLLDEAQTQVAIAQQIVRKINVQRKTAGPEVIVYEGQEGWQTAYRGLMRRFRRGDAEYALGAGADKWVDAMGNYFITYERECREKNIDVYLLAYEWQRDEIEAHQKNLVREVRYLPKDYDMPANMEISPDGIFIQIYSEPLILIEIRSKEVAAGYLQHFKSLWEVAKK